MPRNKRRNSVSPDLAALNSSSSNVGTVTMSDDQFNRLLSALQTGVHNVKCNDSSVSDNLSNNTPLGNFANCTTRFSGESDCNVDAFLDAILTYKSCTNVQDDNALRGLPLLLEGKASLWFQGVKKELVTWEDAVEALKDAFSTSLSPSEVFREIFKHEQEANENTELFICKIRALFAQLPYRLPSEAEIDIVYSLLNHKIRKRIVRSDIVDFGNLLKRTRDIELSLRHQNRDENKSVSKKVENALSSKNSNVRCNYCRSFGHIRENCEKLRTKSLRGTSPPQVQPKENDFSPRPQIKCFGCGAPGVTRSRCSNCQVKKELANTVSTSNEYRLSSYSPYTKLCTATSRPVMSICVDDVEWNGFADSGAEVSIAGYALYQHLLKAGYEFTESIAKFSLADGVVRTENILKVNVPLQIKNKTVTVCFIVFPKSTKSDTLLGVDFLSEANIILNLPHRSWYFAEDTSQQYSFASCKDVKFVTRTPEASKECTMRPEEGPALNLKEREAFSELLRDNADIFELGGGPPTKYATHRIRTVDCEPKAVPPYPLNGPKKEFLRKEVDKLLKEGVIEECESPWSSPVVLVPKPNGSYRMCLDFRSLNSVTIADSYPLPRIDDLLQSAKSTAYMSTIDLQSGFWQVPLAEEDKDKTCFITPFGTYRFNRMPFGLRNAPMTFSRLMHRFRSGLGERAVFAYLDDILILSETFQEHFDDISAVFSRLREFNLRARREKCFFIRNSVKYLGHVISTSGIAPDPAKVEAISKMLYPKGTKHVASFVATCSWYRKFISGFSDIARPLTNLLKKGAKFRFGVEEKQAFETLKIKLTSAPLLIQANYDQPFVIRTDASAYALGAVLLQGQGQQEQPIEYASRLLTSAEKNYSAVEREALAVVWALEKFRCYVEGAEVTVASDCQALQWLLSLKSPTGRLARWALRIQGLNIKIIYTPGKNNVIADTLSRPFCDHDTDDSCGVCLVSVEMPQITSADFRTQQLADVEIRKIIEALENVDGLDTKSWLERGFIMSNGVLYHFNDDFEELEDPQLVIPVQCRAQIMKDHHDSATGGHYGADRTIRKISRKFYFPGLRKFVQNYVKQCTECQRYKVSNTKPAGLLQTPTPSQRFETLSVDLFGPLPETTRGHRWILVCEDTATKWVELFPLVTATSEVCAKILIEEIFLRYGTCRKIISDNGVQFVSNVMQKVTYCFDIQVPFIPLYHAEANPVERKNRDIKTMLSILVQNEHNTWDEYLPSIRFALNSTYTEATGYSPAYLSFGRELRAPRDSVYDFRKVVEAENFVPRITPYLMRLKDCLQDSTQHVIREQDRRKKYADTKRRPEVFSEGEKVLLRTHMLSNAKKGLSAKFAPKRDGPYLVKEKISPTTFILTTLDSREDIGRYHARDLTAFHAKEEVIPPAPMVPKRKRGRPRKTPLREGENTTTLLPMPLVDQREASTSGTSVARGRNPTPVPVNGHSPGISPARRLRSNRASKNSYYGAG